MLTLLVMASNKSFAVIVFFLGLSCFFASLVASLDTLNQGDKLNSSTYLVSSRKIFTLGFYSPADSNSSYLGIWYTNDSFSTPVWIGNRNTPIADESGVLMIDNVGKLIITSKEGAPIELYGGQTSTNITATLMDSGNFMVTEVNYNGSKKRVLWESFDYPTNTLLPGMKLGVNHRTGREWTLTSGSATDVPASGPFTLEWDPAKRRLIVRHRGVIYWTSGVLGEKDFEFIKTDVLNINYKFINCTTKEEEYFTYSLVQDPAFTPEEPTVLSGWVLDYMGQIYDKDRLMIAQVNLCYGYNTDKGCELWKQPNCRNRYQKFDVRSGYFGGIGYQDNNMSLGLSDCRLKCWNDCDCVAFRTSFNGIGCLFWTKDLEFHQDYSGSELKHYVLVEDQPPNEGPNLQPNKGVKKKQMWIPSTAAAIAFIMLGFGFLCYLKGRKIKLLRRFRKTRKVEDLIELKTTDGSMDTNELGNDGNKGNDLIVFGFESIFAATNGFSSENKLGEGGFGPVYKGTLMDGREIAVKRLSRSSGQGTVEFKNELIIIAKLQHVNLVRLLGCCIQGDENMLIYEHMINKSLDSFLFDPFQNEKLTWEKRFNIIEGIAQGLLYLHKYSRLKIIHRDLKASNILLDENMNPKISDFGMARIFKQSVLEVNTNRIVGTYGYMAPEYAMEGIFSVKSDVFSFGVLMLEIVSGRKNNSFYHVDGPLNLVGYAWDLWNKNAVIELVDPVLSNSCVLQQVLRCIHVGLLCVEDRAVDRPTMSDVISTLANDNMTLSMPKKPAFVSGISSVLLEDSNRSKLEKCSLNGLSVSAMEAR